MTGIDGRRIFYYSFYEGFLLHFRKIVPCSFAAAVGCETRCIQVLAFTLFYVRLRPDRRNRLWLWCLPVKKGASSRDAQILARFSCFEKTITKQDTSLAPDSQIRPVSPRNPTPIPKKQLRPGWSGKEANVSLRIFLACSVFSFVDALAAAAATAAVGRKVWIRLKKIELNSSLTMRHGYCLQKACLLDRQIRLADRSVSCLTIERLALRWSLTL